MANARKIPAPIVTVETQAFWNAARERRFVVPSCGACGKAHWYPRAICPFCGSDKIAWRNASGRGAIHSFSVMRRAKEPYAIAYVTLAEGPTMLTNIVDCDFDALAIGQPVLVVFQESENGPPVPMFRPEKL
ncbi:MAG: Zn-ribbon domain-containing OB-fold protein [Xanthobacteraceae bacterium]